MEKEIKNRGDTWPFGEGVYVGDPLEISDLWAQTFLDLGSELFVNMDYIGL